jgi:hypothetical protein
MPAVGFRHKIILARLSDGGSPLKSAPYLGQIPQSLFITTRVDSLDKEGMKTGSVRPGFKCRSDWKESTLPPCTSVGCLQGPYAFLEAHHGVLALQVIGM